MAVTNISKLTSSNVIYNSGSIPIVVPLDEIGRAREAFEKIEVAAQLCQRILDKAEQYGEAAALDGARDAMRAVADLLR